MAGEDAPETETVDPVDHEQVFGQLLQDIAVGLVFLGLVFVFQSRNWQDWVPTDAYFDWFMPVLAGLAPEGRQRSFLFIDIDHRTARALGDPLLTPRHRIVELLDFATSRKGPESPGARLVVLDIALGHRFDEVDGRKPLPAKDTSCDEGGEGPAWLTSEADRILWTFFCNPDDARPPVLLARAFDLGARGGEQEWHGGAEASFLDGHPNIAGVDWFTSAAGDPADDAAKRAYWASPLFLRDDKLIIRGWHLWSSFCSGNGATGSERIDILPSVQLASLALTNDEIGPGRLRDRLTALLRKRTACTPEMLQDLDEAELDNAFAGSGAPRVDLGHDDLGRRVLYTLPWDKDLRQRVPERLEVLPACAILEPSMGADEGTKKDKGTGEDEVEGEKHLCDRPGEIDRSILDDRIVVIGASNPQARDMHGTPVGAMPGGVVLINAIQSLNSYGTLQPVSGWVQFVSAVVLVVAVIALFYVLNFRLAALVSAAGLFLIGLLILWQGLERGYWLDLAMPAAAILLFQKIVAPLGAIRKIRDVGFLKALLHPRFHD